MEITPKKDYLKALQERAKKSRVYQKHQSTGLLIAGLLDDDKHKSLYIGLAKKHNNEDLMQIAKDISERRNIKIKGAYFMSMLKKFQKEKKSDDKLK